GGKTEASLDALRAATAAAPDAPRPHLRYVRALLAQGRRAEVRTEYEARAARPEATDAERTIAERLRTTGASSSLRRVYTAAAERNPETAWWRLALVEVESAEADAWNRRRLDAIDRHDRGAEREAFLQARGAMRRAQRALERADEVERDLAEVHLYRGILRGIEGDLQSNDVGKQASYRAALDAFATATRRDPLLVEAWSGLGDAHFRLGDQREALIAYLEAVRLAPADPDLRIGLGVVLHDVGRLREAGDQYRHAADLRPWDADAMLRYGDVRSDARDYRGALVAYDEALRRDPKALDAHYRSGVIHEHLGRPAEARAAYARYVDLGGTRAATVERRIERLLRQAGR
ncbi:MAG: tetratricopeptide repeat protein, partial [Planctomycetota bacterium]|nr:tetratricopeptide repeat protein [Planctomycetota bacterium]